MPWLALLWGVALDAVVVRGSSSCPSSAAVTARLAPLVRDGGGPPDVAEIVRQGTRLSISLARADGRPIGTQELEGTACDDLAEAAAVILASWENDESRREGLSLEPSSRAPRGDEPSRRRNWTAALGVGGTLASGSLAPAVVGNGSFAPGAGNLGLRIGGGFDGLGTVYLPAGRVRWTRFVFGGGPSAVWSNQTLAAEVHVGAYLGWVRSEGEGFGENRTDQGFDLAGVANLRIASSGVGFRPWAEAGVAWRPSPVVAYELPGGTEGRLPAVAVGLTAGVLFGR
jgi:hypothetical protein